MADVVITEFMDEAAVAELAAIRDTLYDPNLEREIALGREIEEGTV